MGHAHFLWGQCVNLAVEFLAMGRLQGGEAAGPTGGGEIYLPLNKKTWVLPVLATSWVALGIICLLNMSFWCHGVQVMRV